MGKEGNCATELINLGAIISYAGDAYILVIKNGASILSQYSVDELYEEQKGLEKDTKAWMYGRVCNKLAGHRFILGKTAQIADFSGKKGTIVPFSQVPILETIRQAIPNMIGD